MDGLDEASVACALILESRMPEPANPAPRAESVPMNERRP